MTLILTDEQRHALERSGGKPIELIDELTGKRYVLMRADQYERLRRLLKPDGLDRELHGNGSSQTP